jgi:ribonuclease BN (tRNA processing enzyme)
MIEQLLPLVSNILSEFIPGIEIVRKIADKLLRKTSVLEFTNNSLEHSDAVVKNIEKIITEFNIQLSKQELYILITSGYLHNIGLSAGYKLAEIEKNIYPHIGKEDIRKMYPQISSDIIENSDLQNSLDIKLQFPSSEYSSIISKICYSHNSISRLNQLPDNSSIYNINIRTRLLGAILYLGDNLHVGRKRVNTNNLPKINASLNRRLFWFSYSCIEKYEISKNIISFYFGKPKNISKKDFQEFITEPITSHFQKEFLRLSLIFENYNISKIVLKISITDSLEPDTDTTDLFLSTVITESSIRRKTDKRKGVIETKLKKKGLIKRKIINNELIVLRRWSSYTPRMPNWNTDAGIPIPYHNVSRGGGYFLIWNNVGIAIDPGYDFLKNLWTLEIPNNNYFELDDINSSIITHAHDDHCHDIEPIISLLYKKRKLSHFKRDFHIYASEGTHIKYERLFSVNDFIKITDLISDGKPNKLNPTNNNLLPYGINIEYLLTKHNETPWLKNHTGVALKLTLTNDTDKIIIGYTSDSQYFSELVTFFEDADMQLLQFGNIGPSFGFFPQYDKNHLGLTGCHDMITSLMYKSPKLFLMDEFGEEEIGSDRINLCDLISKLTNLSSMNKILLPMDIGLRIELPSLNVYCQEHKHFIPYQNIVPHLPGDDSGIVYFCR